MDKSSVEGLRGFREDLATGFAAQRAELRQRLIALGIQMTIEIKAGVPVKTGALRESVRFVVLDTGKGEKLDIKVGDETAPYGPHVEFGTAHAPAHPFVRPVVYQHEHSVPAHISEGIEKAWS